MRAELFALFVCDVVAKVVTAFKVMLDDLADDANSREIDADGTDV